MPSKMEKMHVYESLRTQRMLTENEVGEIRSRRARGEGKRKIAKVMGISVNTVLRYSRMTEAQADQARCHQHMHRACQLDPVRDFVETAFWDTDGNCQNVVELLEQKLNIKSSLRTVQWYCKNRLNVRSQYSLKKDVQAKHPYRIETGPGEEVQIDFGEKDVNVNGIRRRVHFFTATLGFSRRIYAEFFFCENQEAWLTGLERSFFYFGGVPRHVICDNAKALVYKPAVHGQLPTYTEDFKSLCRYWGTRPIACHPKRPQHKGKVERTVEYLKNSFLKDFRQFKSLEDIQVQFCIWEQTIASQRKMETADVIPEPFTPKGRFSQEKEMWAPCDRSPIADYHYCNRKVDRRGHICIGSRYYSVPIELRGQVVDLLLNNRMIVVCYGGKSIVRLDRDLDVCQPISRFVFKEPVQHPIGIELPNSPMDRKLAQYAEVIGQIEYKEALSCRTASH